MNIAIVGGGPAGFAAGILASNSNNRVVIFEKNPEVLKKLLLTGNGKCNYRNANQSLDKYHTTYPDIAAIINPTNLKLVSDFWNNLGIIPIIKNGYYYPFSEKASSMKSALLKKSEDLGITIKCHTEITNIEYKENKFLVQTSNFTETFDKVIIATGSLAYPKTGSTGFGYEVAQKYNHHIVSLNPSLVQLVSNSSITSNWSGIRSNVIVKNIEDNKICKEESGEIQLTDYGVSGICIFNLSRNISIGLTKGKKEKISINFVPWCQSNFLEFLNNRHQELPNRNITELCDAFLNYKLLYAICKYSHINPDKSWDKLTAIEQKLFAQNLTDFELIITATKDYNYSQVCSGGVSLADLNLQTLESLKIPGLYFCGEVLDLDGDCGGYNLTIAILSGIIAGSAAKEDIYA